MLLRKPLTLSQKTLLNKQKRFINYNYESALFARRFFYALIRNQKRMRNIRSLIVAVVLLSSLTELVAQNNSFAKANLPIWQNAKNRTLAVARAMPADQYSYKPTTSVMSFGQQMAHIANSMRSMEMRFLKNAGWNQQEPNAASMTKEAIIAMLSSSFDAVIETIGSLTEADLTKPGKNFGSPALNKEQSMLFMFDHITNHRAKAVLYLRMKGIQPPRYGFN